tara:strand:+ start:398 stop:961 length:564 start_codon:yes stop_codon:yes gene_type:complete
MNRKEAKHQFDFWTNMLGIDHTFSFDDAYDYLEYKNGKSLIHNPKQFIPANFSKKQFRKAVVKVEEKMKQSKRSLTGNDIEKSNPLKHSFADGCYIREVFNPKGELIVTRIHKKTHPFFLLKGEMSILSEDGEKRIKAPHYGITKSGTKRIIYSHEDCVFVTVHATSNKNISDIEEEVVTDNYKELL